jgi:tRNA-modifying protein YgfZ
MLNLDRLDAISFTKGCYTGQEIVARTQHLGRIKRRTLRYRLAGGEPPAPLSGLVLEDRKVGEVLMSAHVGPTVEILAVTSLDARDRTLRTEDGREATPLPLPYPLGEADSG